jgi:purine nucleosidase
MAVRTARTTAAREGPVARLEAPTSSARTSNSGAGDGITPQTYLCKPWQEGRCATSLRRVPLTLEQLLAPPRLDAVVDVVIDTDPTNEIDDQFAIAWALLRPERLRVQGLYGCPYSLSPELVARPGLVSELDRRGLDASLSALGMDYSAIPVITPAEGVERATQECRDLVRMAGVDVPVLEGARGYLTDASTPVRSDAVEHLIELAHQDREGPLYVLGMGCATNLASALLLDPTIRDEVTIVWTSAHPTFWPHPNASFNLVQDLPAAHALFASGAAHVYLPGYYVGEGLRTSLPELEGLVKGRGPLGDHLYEISATSLHLGSGPGRSKVMWDLINVAWCLNPAWLTTHLVPTPSLAEDLRWQPGNGITMREATAVNRDAVFLDLFQALDAHRDAQPAN